MPVRMIITQGADVDCQHRGYDVEYMVKQAEQQGMMIVIPPCKNTNKQRDYDKFLHTIRHLVEHAFLHLKQWRGIATRYGGHLDNYSIDHRYCHTINVIKIIKLSTIIWVPFMSHDKIQPIKQLYRLSQYTCNCMAILMTSLRTQLVNSASF